MTAFTDSAEQNPRRARRRRALQRQYRTIVYHPCNEVSGPAGPSQVCMALAAHGPAWCTDFLPRAGNCRSTQYQRRSVETAASG